MIERLVRRNRSYRRFKQEVAVERSVLRELVDLARLSASAMNLQPLRFILACEPEKNRRVFPHLRWAGFLKDWPGPAEGERPSAYIVILNDTGLAGSCGCDHGIAAQSILLGASERGLGGCMIGSIDKKGLREALDIPPRYDIVLAVALGETNEKVVIEEAGPDGDTKYYRTADGVHHVPKRSLDDIILG
ncbi:MAG: nitroreductase family protein [Elusimicrobiota bacterium]